MLAAATASTSGEIQKLCSPPWMMEVRSSRRVWRADVRDLVEVGCVVRSISKPMRSVPHAMSRSSSAPL